jgi:hypothetical protein
MFPAKKRKEGKKNCDKSKTHSPPYLKSHPLFFFRHNEALKLLLCFDRHNFINFSIQNKLEMVGAMTDCLLAMHTII